MQKQRSREFFATQEELVQILGAIQARGVHVYLAVSEKQRGGHYKLRFRPLALEDLPKAVATGNAIFIGETKYEYSVLMMSTAEMGLTVVLGPSMPWEVKEPSMLLCWVAVNSGEARQDIERSGRDEPNRFDAVDAADAAYNAFVKELKKFTTPATVLVRHVSEAQGEPHKPKIFVSRGAWERRSRMTFVDCPDGTMRYELVDAQT